MQCESTLIGRRSGGVLEDDDWARKAIALLQSDGRRSADTHLLHAEFPGLKGIAIYLKDESTHPTGSLKHRLARSLFIYAICNGKVGRGKTVVEASSGSTAVSEAYFARLLGLPFIAVMAKNTSPQKIASIEYYGGRCHLVARADEIYEAASAVARETNGYYLDQFTYAERATDWRGNNNIAESIFEQMSAEPYSIPTWIIMGAGTGGTAATLGRFVRYRGFRTKLCIADVEHSAFYEAFRTGNKETRCSEPSRIEGVGRPRVEPSFIPSVIDRMVKIPDAASIAAMRIISRRLSRPVGGSTGTNFFAACWIASEMIERGESGALATLICDSGDRYRNTYYCDNWLRDNKIDISPYVASIEEFLDSGNAGGLFDLESTSL